MSRGKPVCQLIMEPQLFVKKGLSTLQCQVYISQNGGVPNTKDFKEFRANKLTYEPFCDDFGPMNMLSVMKFIELLDFEIIAKSPSRNVVYCAEEGVRNFTNAAFLLGAYMVLKLDCQPDDVLKCFSGLESTLFEGYRDATFSVPDFKLKLIDCWKGLYQGKAKGWVALPTPQNPSLWGMIDVGEYERCDDYLNGDLHIVVPSLFVAFKGPKDVDGLYKDNFQDGRFHSRDFSPKYYSEVFQDINVSTVIRLNEIRYQKRGFAEHGIDHHDLFFEDCTSPPSAIVAKFFDIIDHASGLVAIHCKAGLGRTGTLIALALIRSHGFTAREAIGWLRIMRPGSVIGEQQAFLVAVEECVRRRVQAAPTRTPMPPPPGTPAARDRSPGRHVRFHPATKSLLSLDDDELERRRHSDEIMLPVSKVPLLPPGAQNEAPSARAADSPLRSRAAMLGGTAGGQQAAGLLLSGGGGPAASGRFAASLRQFGQGEVAEATPAVLASQVATAMDRRGANKAMRVMAR